MHVHQKLWQRTTITTVLSPFPGVLGEFLQEITPQQILRAEKFLPHIFWRWYMLENQKNANPYLALAWRREKEKWDQEGQFFPQPKLHIIRSTNPFLPQTTEPKVQIDITVDYISFAEQPIIIDVINALKKKPLQYPYDEQYCKDVSLLADALRKADMTPTAIIKHPLIVLEYYFRQTLLAWREQDQFNKSAFSKNAWLNFWKDILLQANDKRGLSTDHLLDQFVDQVRKTHPDYGIKSADLENINGPKDINIHVKMQYFFLAVTFISSIAASFTLFCHLLAPIFVEQDMFTNDINALLANDFIEPMPIYAPFTTLTITPFGQKFLKHLVI